MILLTEVFFHGRRVQKATLCPSRISNNKQIGYQARRWRTGILKTLLLITLLVAAFFAALSAQTAAPARTPGIEEAYLAKDNGKGSAGDMSVTFRPTDIPIYCVVLLDTLDATTVKMNFVAVNVPGVKPETKVVTASYTTKQGSNRVNFTGRPDSRWTPGAYRVDLFVNGDMAKSLDFDITGSVAAPPAAASFTKPANAQPATRRPRKP
jgi:hypothetical protein